MNVDELAVVGVPESMPPGERLRSAGSDPATTVNVADPPLAVSVWA